MSSLQLDGSPRRGETTNRPSRARGFPPLGDDAPVFGTLIRNIERSLELPTALSITGWRLRLRPGAGWSGTRSRAVIRSRRPATGASELGLPDDRTADTAPLASPRSSRLSRGLPSRLKSNRTTEQLLRPQAASPRGSGKNLLAGPHSFRRQSEFCQRSARAAKQRP